MDIFRNQSNGRAVLRLIQFAEQLSPGERATDRTYWDSFVDEFFTHRSIMKYGLFNIEDNERRAFEINQLLLPRYFHTQYMCGVTSIQIIFEQTLEYILPGGYMNVECPRASIINKFENGTMVISTGNLWVHFVLTGQGWKIEHLDFSCEGHEEYLMRTQIKTEPIMTNPKKKTPATSTVTKFPPSSINKWGVPSRVYHLLQIADIAPRLSEVAFHSLISGASPKESLGAIAFDKQQEIKDNDTDIKHENVSISMGASSPIVKTQTGTRSTQPSSTPLQQQAALRQHHIQQQQQNAFQLHQAQQPSTPGHSIAYQSPSAYPNQFTSQSPVARKRNSITSDVKSPAPRKKNTATRK